MRRIIHSSHNCAEGGGGKSVTAHALDVVSQFLLNGNAANCKQQDCEHANHSHVTNNSILISVASVKAGKHCFVLLRMILS